MASGLFKNFKVKQMNLDATAPGSVDFLTDTLQPSLPDAGGANAPVLATDEDLADITLFNADHQGGDLASLATSAGYYDAADTTITAPTIEAAGHKDVMLHKEHGTHTSATLIAIFDLGTPVITDGNDVIIQWNASGILDFGP